MQWSLKNLSKLINNTAAKPLC